MKEAASGKGTDLAAYENKRPHLKGPKTFASNELTAGFGWDGLLLPGWIDLILN